MLDNALDEGETRMHDLLKKYVSDKDTEEADFRDGAVLRNLDIKERRLVSTGRSALLGFLPCSAHHYLEPHLCSSPLAA